MTDYLEELLDQLEEEEAANGRTLDGCPETCVLFDAPVGILWKRRAGGSGPPGPQPCGAEG